MTKLRLGKTEPVTLHGVHRFFKNIISRSKAVENEGRISRKQPVIKAIVGEEESSMTTFLALLGNRCVAVFGYAGTGKTIIMNSMEKILPPTAAHRVQYGSQAAVWYQADDMNKARVIIFPEFQKAAKGMQNDIEEIMKDIGEGVASTRGVTDIILSKQLGEDTIVNQVINPHKDLCFITALAMENDKKMGAELGRRVVAVYTTCTMQQIEKVLDFKANVESAPTKNLLTMTDAEKEKVLDYVAYVFEPRRDLIIKNPGAGYIKEKIPSRFPISMTYIDHVFAVIRGATTFHIDDRIQTKLDIVLATPADNWYAWTIYGRLAIESCLKVPYLGREIMSVFPKPKQRENLTAADTLTETDIIRQLRTKGIELTRGNLRAILSSMLIANYLECDDDRGVKNYYVTPDTFDFESAINWREFAEGCAKRVEEMWPEYAEEYREKYCTNPIEVVHPFTGETINILDEKHREIKEKIIERPKAVAKTVKGDQTLDNW